MSATAESNSFMLQRPTGTDQFQHNGKYNPKSGRDSKGGEQNMKQLTVNQIIPETYQLENTELSVKNIK